MIRRLTVNYPLSDEDAISIANFRNNYDAMLRPDIGSYI